MMTIHNYVHALLLSFTNIYFIPSPEKSPHSSGPGAAVGVVGAMLAVVAVTAVVVLTVYCFMCARKKG